MACHAQTKSPQGHGVPCPNPSLGEIHLLGAEHTDKCYPTSKEAHRLARPREEGRQQNLTNDSDNGRKSIHFHPLRCNTLITNYLHHDETSRRFPLKLQYALTVRMLRFNELACIPLATRCNKFEPFHEECCGNWQKNHGNHPKSLVFKLYLYD
jgi:hypothetical protein